MTKDARILLAHGGGGRLTHELVCEPAAAAVGEQDALVLLHAPARPA